MAKRSTIYIDEFKRDAIRLMRSCGKRTVAQIADDLGVTDGMLCRCADKLSQESIAKRSEQGGSLEQENRRLCKEKGQLRLSYFPRARYLELSPRDWQKTRFRLDVNDLAQPIGRITALALAAERQPPSAVSVELTPRILRERHSSHKRRRFVKRFVEPR